MFILVDIDGTLIDKEYNTTFRLLLDFLKIKQPNFWWARLLLLRGGLILESIIAKKISMNFARLFSKIYLSVVLFMIDYSELHEFTVEWILHSKYDKTLIKVLKKFDNVIVLTASIEPVARIVARMLNTNKYASSSFITKNDRIIMIKKRHLLNSKFDEVKNNKWFPYVYIVDNPEDEYVVSKNSTLTIKHHCCRQKINYIKLKRLKKIIL